MGTPQPKPIEHDSAQIVGILNVSPDSFSDGGELGSEAEIRIRAEQFIAEGAAILDVGAEASGPKSKVVSAEVEWKRLQPALKALTADFTVSVDTYKSQTAEQALQIGAKIINDISALRADENMAHVIADAGCPVVMMYSKEEAKHPHVSAGDKIYQDVIEEIAGFLSARVDYALSKGIAESKIILDPGMGAFVSHDANISWEIIRRFDELVEKLKPFPLFVGTSRKGFLGGALKDRDPISQLTALACVERGAKYIRTHNVAMAKQFLFTWQNIKFTS